jgi:hypothetical protein
MRERDGFNSVGKIYEHDVIRKCVNRHATNVVVIDTWNTAADLRERLDEFERLPGFARESIATRISRSRYQATASRYSVSAGSTTLRGFNDQVLLFRRAPVPFANQCWRVRRHERLRHVFEFHLPMPALPRFPLPRGFRANRRRTLHVHREVVPKLPTTSLSFHVPWSDRSICGCVLRVVMALQKTTGARKFVVVSLTK